MRIVRYLSIISLYLGKERMGRDVLKLTGHTVEYIPQNWPITVRVLFKR